MTNVFNTLYAVLTLEPKTIADQTIGETGHRGTRFGPRFG